ncbi:MAG: hypothetical protein Q4C03_07775 [bacterium]|nr:hypothetical protein [bacterium]
MHQEITRTDPGSAARFRLFVLLVAALLVTRLLMALVAALPHAGIIQVAIVLVPILLFLWIYKRRLSEYRYTLYFREPPEGELDEFGDQARLAQPLGTLILESVTGRRTRVLEIIRPAEHAALLAPGERRPDGTTGLCPLLAGCPKAQAHTLVYRRGGSLRCLMFSPSKELEQMLCEIISAVNDCGGGE